MPFASLVLPLAAAAAVATAVAVPLLIHLLHRQRVRVVEWAAMRFLLAAQKRHHKRIDQWILLAARMFALLLPLLGMLAVAPWAEDLWQRLQPGTAETLANAPRTHYVLVLDGSLSMNARPEKESRFEAAVRLAQDHLRAANPGDGFTVIFLAGPAQVIVPGPANDAEKVAAEVAALKPTDGNADFAGGLAAVADALSRSPRSYPRRQVLFFTDLQRSAWAPTLPKPNDPPSDAWQRIAAKAEVAVVDVAGTDLQNLAVTDLALADPLPLVDAPTAITATVQNFGSSDRKLVRAELLLAKPAGPGQDPALFPVQERIIEAIPAGGRASVTFALEGTSRFRVPGIHVLQVKLADADELPTDDARSLAIEVREGLPCLIVNGRAATEPLRRASEYLSEALAPGGRIFPGNPARPRVVSPEEFNDASLTDLTAVDAVFLCDVPTLSPGQVARLEALLKRGGGVVIGLGPNAAANAELYNRLLYADGRGLLPGKLTTVADASGADDPGFRLVADDDSYRRPPLIAFQDDNARAGLTGVPFRKFVNLDAGQDGRARRILSFVPAKVAEGVKPAPAVVELPRHRGRVVVYTSTFNADWNDWPRLPSYLPFVHELLRYAATNPDRHTLGVGEGLEEFVPANAVGLNATLTGPDGFSAGVPVIVGDDVGLVRFADTPRAGLYRSQLSGQKPTVFAVNPPASAPGGGSESDLKRLDPAELKSVVPGVQVVASPADVKLTSGEGELAVTTPRAHGPTIARWFVTLGILLFVAETLLAWRVGPGRTGTGNAERPEPSAKRRVIRLLALVPLLLALVVLASVWHAERTGHLLGFLPDSWRKAAEASVGVPAAGPGEGTRWRLDSANAYAAGRVELWAVLGIAGVALGAVLLAYRGEGRGTGSIRRLLLPGALRVAALLLVLFVVLPQLRIAFDREGWPDVAILLDNSASMSTVDALRDPAVRARAEELQSLAGLSAANRFQLAKALLAHPKSDLVNRILNERQAKVHVYTIADQAKLVATLDEAADPETGRAALAPLNPDGPTSRLGDGVQAVLKAFRGGSLAAIVVLTDGVTTAGDDLPTAGRAAARAGVPLYLVGVGDAKDPLDLALGDLRAEDVVAKNDEIMFEARLTARGANVPKSVTVTLSEKKGDAKIKLAEQTLTPDPDGKPVPVRLRHTPTETGEKQYVIEVPAAPGEPDATNNVIERLVTVTDNRKLRALYIEATPRYEFRFVKVLLERETEAGRAVRSVDMNTLLLDAGKDHFTTERTALRGFPTRAELFEYDVVILGDVNPASLQRPAQALADLADFVRIRGGGLLLIAGEHANPHRLFDTPLADVMPILPAEARAEPPPPNPESSPLADGYKPRLTPAGSSHPLFRFGADDAASARIWGKLQPMYWHAAGFKRRQTAEVLAVHPDKPGEGGENFPLAVQQFAGAGRVVFFAFDETWRWRFRQDEEQFNRFWRQAIRVLARNRVARTELKTDKQTPYRRDEPIAVRVQFPDDAPPPTAEGVRVSVRRVSPAGEIEDRKLTLAKVEGSRATFQALLTSTPEGKYKFRLLEPEVKGNAPTADATVLPPAGELDRVEVNRADLQRAAAESRGKLYTLADADKLIDELPDGVRVSLNQPCPPVPVWNHAASFGLIVMLLGMEWIVRRRERLL